MTARAGTSTPMRSSRRSATDATSCSSRSRSPASPRRSSASDCPVDLLVLLNAMIPLPGETGNDWWANTGSGEAHRAYLASLGITGTDAQDDRVVYFHDVPDAVVEEAFARGEPQQSMTPMGQPFALRAWPDVPTRVLAGRDDRLFPVEFQRRVARERLGHRGRRDRGRPHGRPEPPARARRAARALPPGAGARLIAEPPRRVRDASLSAPPWRARGTSIRRRAPHPRQTTAVQSRPGWSRSGSRAPGGRRVSTSCPGASR